MHLAKTCFAVFAAGIVSVNASLAGDMRTVKFESRYTKKIKGAACRIVVEGQTFEFVTPARVQLPLNASGQLQIDKMACDLQGIKRTTDFFPDEAKFDREIHGISVDFKDKEPAFSYLKKNGGMAVWYTRDGMWVPVR